MASLLNNTGDIIASVEDDSTESFRNMLTWMGVKNMSIHRPGLEHQLQEGKKNFDKVLLCAPSTEQCLGSSVLKSRMTDTEVEKMIQKKVKVQKKMLLEAIDLVKPEGYVVYCTRSVFIEENENVVDHAVNNRNVKLVDVPHNINDGRAEITLYGEQKFDESMKKARRYYPHINNMECLFLAKLQKTG